jgi:predicted phage-related endonuclease
VLEIKCPGAADHSKALAGEVPEKYWPQLQHQLLVTGANKAHYYSFDGEKGVLIEVEPDKKYCAKLFIEIKKFWDCVESDTPPALSKKDFKTVKDSELEQLCEKWLELDRSIKVMEKNEKEIREKITAHEKVKDHPFVKIGNVSVQLISRKGAVDYAKIPELKSVDLENYRKNETSYYKFGELKND